jgi:hypothetical protein
MNFISKLFGKKNPATSSGNQPSRSVEPRHTEAHPDPTVQPQASASQSAQSAVSSRRSGETVLYAFFAQATETSGLLGFRQKVVFTHPLDDWKDKIREQTQCPGMEVVIVPSEEWDPPSIRSFSESDLRSVFPQVRAKIQRAMSKMSLPDISSQQLTAEGGVVGSPLSGKIFFVHKVTF